MDRQYTIHVNESRVRDLTRRAADAGYSVEGYLETLAGCTQLLPEEMCYVVFEGVPEVFYGPGLKEAEERAAFKAGEVCGIFSIMAVPRAAVTEGMAQRWVGTVGVTLQEAMKLAAHDRFER